MSRGVNEENKEIREIRKGGVREKMKEL